MIRFRYCFDLSAGWTEQVVASQGSAFRFRSLRLRFGFDMLPSFRRSQTTLPNVDRLSALDGVSYIHRFTRWSYKGVSTIHELSDAGELAEMIADVFDQH